MKKLSEIINSQEENLSQTEEAVQAAFWAGQSNMRGTITEQVRAALKTIEYGRYHNEQKRVINHVLSNCGTLNVYGYDSGRGESAEILDWDFDI